MGPPWQADWTKEAEDNRNTLPDQGRALVDAARAELVTAADPYFRGIDAVERSAEVRARWQRRMWPRSGKSSPKARTPFKPGPRVTDG